MKANRLVILFRDLCLDARDFGPKVAFTGFRVGLPHYLRQHPRLEPSWQDSRHSAIRTYVGNRYGAVAETYASERLPEVPPDAPIAPIWTVLWQGEDAAPEIVKYCLESLRRYGGRPVVCITEANHLEFVSIPEHIRKKVALGKISVTHLSDYIRYAVLADRGGLWLDATVYLTEPIPVEVHAARLFTCKRQADQLRFVSKYRWTSWALGAEPGHPLFRLCRDLMDHYWADHDRLIDYLLIDYLLELAYLRVPACRDDIDAVPINNPQADGLYALLNEPFDHEIWAQVTRETWMHKLTRKLPVHAQVGRRQTFYGHLGELDVAHEGDHFEAPHASPPRRRFD